MTWTLHIQDGESRILLGEYVDRDAALAAYRAMDTGLNRADVEKYVHLSMDEVKPPLPTEVGSLVTILQVQRLDAPQHHRTLAMLREDGLWVLAKTSPSGHKYFLPEDIIEWEATS